jgi:hypothetical protein
MQVVLVELVRCLRALYRWPNSTDGFVQADFRFFAPFTDELQVSVFETLVKIAGSKEKPEVLRGRALFPILNRLL